jgi:PqqD family protein of HPr-rel-A system
MWRVIAGQSLQYRAWDDEFVLYNNLSGDTHLLGASAIHVLLALQRAALDADGLALSLCAALQLERDAELDADVAELVASLGALSLIERIAC